MTKVFIDGSAGTTGLRIYDRLSDRKDIELIILDDDKRKDNKYRKEAINSCDIAFLCLPDDAAREAITLVDNPNTAIIDTSTAHRVNDAWAYGFAELSPAHRQAIRESKRIANPGCHASGFISTVCPLVAQGVIPADFPLTAYSLTGYSGGGKSLIAEYEDNNRDIRHESHRIYGTTLTHTHLPEMQKLCGLKNSACSSGASVQIISITPILFLFISNSSTVSVSSFTDATRFIRFLGPHLAPHSRHSQLTPNSPFSFILLFRRAVRRFLNSL